MTPLHPSHILCIYAHILAILKFHNDEEKDDKCKKSENIIGHSHFVLHAFNKLVNSFLVIAQQKNVIVSESMIQRILCAHTFLEIYVY